uniref:Apple domain-containing protein n=1 Tax=Parascaris univalens TaxID=6257 RepID=A0A915BI56_PARUN
MYVIYLFTLLMSVDIAEAVTTPNHFGNPCVLCHCFIEYTDRDQPTGIKPFGVAENPYNSTEDRCLVTCLRDNRCQSVVYGLVGGRDVFTCELYEESQIPSPGQLLYEPYVNTYLPKDSPCTVPHAHLQSLPLIIDEETSEMRKQRFRKLANQRNPFNFGR